jgi:Mg2+ and Co2+ transporter CorA
VIRIKWSLHAREEIIHELMTHFKRDDALAILKKVHKKTREMLEEQDAVRDRLFTVQDVMQSNVRQKLQERSVRVTHNLSVIGGSGLVLSVIVGLFGINLDGIPGNADSPYAFAVFSLFLALLGAVSCPPKRPSPPASSSSRTSSPSSKKPPKPTRKSTMSAPTPPSPPPPPSPTLSMNSTS